MSCQALHAPFSIEPRPTSLYLCLLCLYLTTLFCQRRISAPLSFSLDALAAGAQLSVAAPLPTPLMSKHRPGPPVVCSASHLSGAAPSSAHSLAGELTIDSAITRGGGATGIKETGEACTRRRCGCLLQGGQPLLSRSPPQIPAITHS